jgi:DNA-binding protein HU-beta
MATSDRFDIQQISDDVRSRLHAGENLDDVLAGAIYLADRRATALDRSATQTDLEHALSIFCFWPYKTPPPARVTTELIRIRRRAFRGAAQGDFAAIDAIVPPETLTASGDELANLQGRRVSTFLRVGQERRVIRNRELADMVTQRTGLPGTQARLALEVALDVMSNELAAGGEVALAGFGKFSVSQRAARQGRNPSTGETINIAASKAAKFSAASALKKRLNE